MQLWCIFQHPYQLGSLGVLAEKVSLIKFFEMPL